MERGPTLPTAASTIRMIVPYFGSFPKWFPAYLLSCKYNPQIEWLFLTDAQPPSPCPSNVRFERLDMNELRHRAETILGCPVNKGVYSQCDLRPAYGVLFEDRLKDAAFWGHCDVDLIWGRLESFLSQTNLARFDILSSRRSQIAGHCTIYRNTTNVNTLFERIPNYRSLLADPGLRRLNESAMGRMLQELRPVPVYWHAQHVVDARELDRRPHGWRWEKGMVLDRDDVERAYVHFMYWKSSLRTLDFGYSDSPSAFRITHRAICSTQAKASQFWLDRFPSLSRMQRRVYNAIRFSLTRRGQR